VPGVLLAPNGLRIALTTPVTNLFTTPTTLGSNGFGVDTADVSTGDDSIEVIRSDVVLDGSVEPVTRLVSTVSVAALCLAGAATVASCPASTVADTGAFVVVGRTAAGSDFLFVAGLLALPSVVPVADGAAELRGWAFVAVASAPRPVPTATPAGPERTASCFVFEPVVFVLVAVDVADERASLLVAPGAFCASGPVLEALVPAVPPGSSAHATPLFHPVRMATPTTKATTKPPTRPTYASLGMRYVYRLGSLGVPGMSETRQFADCCRPRLASRRICRARKRMSVM